MTNVKPTLPREVADAIESMRKEGHGNFTIMRLAQGSIFDGPLRTIQYFAFNGENGGTPDILMSALINGYEIEKLPEDHVKDYFNRLNELAKQCHEKADHEQESEFLAEITGVTHTLNLLGIKIEGVNA